ncbi:IS3 family transposase [Secundilactobacillus hailunensis]|uniref:IS3 family transposase n=1 Tax=Secundilactobacillus hailunensis TaxID=2559923 RepID=A0ABW1T957_9LACO
MKDEFFNFHQATTRTELINLINQYIHWYSTKCLQQTLNGMTPEEYRNHAVQNCA